MAASVPYSEFSRIRNKTASFEITPDGVLIKGNINIPVNNGIKFGNSSTDSALSDYEEGTWQPTFVATTTNPNLQYFSRQGTYTKIGNLVTIAGHIDVLSVISSGSGDLQIGNLPFSVDSSYQYMHTNIVSAYLSLGAFPAGAPLPYDYRLQAFQGNTAIIKYSYNYVVPTSVLFAGSKIWFSLTYKTI